MEQIVYFQGEDIAITAEAFEDNGCTASAPLTDYQIDVLLYTDAEGRNLYGSSVNQADFVVAIDDSGIASMVIPSHLSRELNEGFLQMELQLRNWEGVVRIAKCTVARIVQSRISKIDAYGS